MAQYEEGQIEFAILGLVRDPLLELLPALAENVRSVAALSTRLDIVKPDWQDFMTSSIKGDYGGSEGLISTASPIYGLTQENIDQAKLPQAVEDVCVSDVASALIEYRQSLISTQASLRMSIREEQHSNQLDEERATQRALDHGARMQDFVRKMKKKRPG